MSGQGLLLLRYRCLVLGDLFEQVSRFFVPNLDTLYVFFGCPHLVPFLREFFFVKTIPPLFFALAV